MIALLGALGTTAAPRSDIPGQSSVFAVFAVTWTALFLSERRTLRRSAPARE